MCIPGVHGDSYLVNWVGQGKIAKTKPCGVDQVQYSEIEEVIKLLYIAWSSRHKQSSYLLSFTAWVN